MMRTPFFPTLEGTGKYHATQTSASTSTIGFARCDQRIRVDLDAMPVIVVEGHRPLAVACKRCSKVLTPTTDVW